MRLNRWFRWFVYAVIAELFVTGLGWRYIETLKTRAELDTLPFWLQATHGGAAMAALLSVGAIIPSHALRSWRARKNRVTGSVLAALMAVLVVTAYGLYYFGTEWLRGWTADIHYWVGVVLPAGLIGHIWFGRYRRARMAQRATGPLQALPDAEAN